MQIKTPIPPQSITRYARYGEWASNVVLLLFAALVAYFTYRLVFGVADVLKVIGSEFDIGDYIVGLSGLKLWIMTVTSQLMSILEVILIVAIRALFIGIRTEGVFVPSMALRLRKIGVIFVAMAPVSIFADAAMSALALIWKVPEVTSQSFVIDEYDVNFVIIGLVLVVVSHIMLEAIRIYDENGEFV